MPKKLHATPKHELYEGQMADGAQTLALIERDAALRNAVIDAALDCIIMMDQDGRIVEFNPAAEKVFGYSRDEAIGAKLADLVVPEDLRGAHSSGLSRYLKTGEHKVLNQRVEVPAVNKAGDKLLVELAISPVEFDGQTFFSGYLRDITEANAAREKLRASEERFQSLFELSPDAIVVINSKGEIVDANSRACEVVGLEKSALLKKSALEFVPEDQLPHASGGMMSAAEGDTVKVQVDFLNASGARIPTEVVGCQIDTETGPVFHGVVRDISERIASENQLRMAKEAAEQANAAKSDFLANMSHEVRTPLNGVIGSLSLIDRSDLDTERASLIKTAERSAETLLTLIDDVLDLSRIEAGEIDLEESPFAPSEFSTIITELFAPAADKKSVDLTTRLNVPEGLMKADIGKIRQVLVNLVGNALKFTQRGQVHVGIEYLGNDAEGELKFEVRDTGIGISKSDQVRLFDRFKQADSSRSKAHGGAGLGLAICKELVAIMDGTISVSSAPGVGSTFSFSVPVRRSAADTPCDAGDINSVGELMGRVLIAEDSETNAMVAKKMLDRLGLDYQHVSDGAAAVDAALTGAFDIVLMDVSMPVMDGLEATRVLRERGFEKPVIAMTAHALKGDKDEAMSSGMTAYLTKPVRPVALREALEQWLPAQAVDAEQETVSPSGLDVSAIEDLWADDLETYAEIGKIFMDELKWRLPGLRTENLSELEHHAHSLKGASANIGATELSRLAAELEALARSNRSERTTALIDAIDAEAACVQQELVTKYFDGAVA